MKLNKFFIFGLSVASALPAFAVACANQQDNAVQRKKAALDVAILKARSESKSFPSVYQLQVANKIEEASKVLYSPTTKAADAEKETNDLADLVSSIKQNIVNDEKVKNAANAKAFKDSYNELNNRPATPQSGPSVYFKGDKQTVQEQLSDLVSSLFNNAKQKELGLLITDFFRKGQQSQYKLEVSYRFRDQLVRIQAVSKTDATNVLWTFESNSLKDQNSILGKFNGKVQLVDPTSPDGQQTDPKFPLSKLELTDLDYGSHQLSFSYKASYVNKASDYETISQVNGKPFSSTILFAIPTNEEYYAYTAPIITPKLPADIKTAFTAVANFFNDAKISELKSFLETNDANITDTSLSATYGFRNRDIELRVGTGQRAPKFNSLGLTRDQTKGGAFQMYSPTQATERHENDQTPPNNKLGVQLNKQAKTITFTYKLLGNLVRKSVGGRTQFIYDVFDNNGQAFSFTINYGVATQPEVSQPKVTAVPTDIKTYFTTLGNYYGDSETTALSNFMQAIGNGKFTVFYNHRDRTINFRKNGVKNKKLQQTDQAVSKPLDQAEVNGYQIISDKLTDGHHMGETKGPSGSVKYTVDKTKKMIKLQFKLLNNFQSTGSDKKRMFTYDIHSDNGQLFELNIPYHDATPSASAPNAESTTSTAPATPSQPGSSSTSTSENNSAAPSSSPSTPAENSSTDSPTSPTAASTSEASRSEDSQAQPSQPAATTGESASMNSTGSGSSTDAQSTDTSPASAAQPSETQTAPATGSTSAASSSGDQSAESSSSSS